MQLSYRKLLLIFVVLLYAGQAYAQLDSIRYKVETGAAVATQGNLPLWIVSNRYGVLEDETDAFVRAGFETPYTKGKRFDVSYGLDLVGKKSLGNSRIQQGFLKVKYGIFEVRGGRIEETTGLQHESLSSGSLAQSRNAMPIPKIAVTVPEYASVPFTKGYLSFKGYWGHGWLGEGRFVENAYLHDKNLYLKVGGDLPVVAYGGFVHYAIWGGEHPRRGSLPSSLRDYLRVFTGKGAMDAGEKGQHQTEVDNALGNHLGIYDFGLVGKIQKHSLSIYHQTPWEDLTSLKLFKNKDRLLGISLQNDGSKKYISEVVYEYLYTKYQSGPGTPDPVPGQSNYGFPYGGRDDYYNNGLYQSGWTYKDNIIGSPLFISRSRFENYLLEMNYYHDQRSIVNNRVVAHHVGAKGNLGNLINYKAKATYTRNYGTYAELNMGGSKWASMDSNKEYNYVFNPPLSQLYIMLEINTVLPFSKNLTLQTAIGYDTGDLSKNLGALIGLRWNGITSIRTKHN